MALHLDRLTECDILELAAELRRVNAGASNRQAVADKTVELLYRSFRVESGEPACALVRCFQTCSYARLPIDYQHVANALLERMPSHPNMRCLSLLATRGAKNVWNDVATSTRHQCIPLPSVEAVKRAPMIARLLEEFGVSIESVVTLAGQPETFISASSAAEDGLNVFHVGDAQGSPFVPAQAEFVEPYGVRSVLAMGGLLGEGDLLAVILFTSVPVSPEVAARFRPLALAMRAAMLPIAARNTFGRLEV